MLACCLPIMGVAMGGFADSVAEEGGAAGGGVAVVVIVRVPPLLGAVPMSHGRGVG